MAREVERIGDDNAVAGARARMLLSHDGPGERGPAWWDQNDEEGRDRWAAGLWALGS
ncbi:hypothetical protein SAMN05661080_03957 [Modestobacter sp. DSM 44400]|nr:hypothetical protein SAMN05661080_03957 [Modestobacter sp. DSM 44400]